MALKCECGEIAATPEDDKKCASDNHRRAKLRRARERLESIELADRGADHFDALAELAYLDSQDPRTPDAADVIDLFHVLEEHAQGMLAATGIRPDRIVMGDTLARMVRRVGDVFPAVCGRTGQAPHARPMSHRDQRPEGWLGQIGGMDLYALNSEST